jgi:hypothetical protein
MPFAYRIPGTEPLYVPDDLTVLRRDIPLHAGPFPPGPERNRQRQIASSLRSLFKNPKWLGRAHVEQLMPETVPASRPAPTAIERPNCPKCSATMMLVRIARAPSGFDIRTFDCGQCDHAHIVTVATDPMKSV